MADAPHAKPASRAYGVEDISQPQRRDSRTSPVRSDGESIIQDRYQSMVFLKPLTRRNLLLIAFAMGFSSALAQVLLIRELLTIFRGNEFIIGIIFAAWFLGIFLGAILNPHAITEILERRVRTSLICLPLVLMLSLYITHFLPLLIPRTIGTFYSIGTELLLSLLLTLPISFLIGFFFPPLVSLTAGEDRERSGGNIYFIESLGAFTGGVLFSFLLIDYFNPLQIVSLLLIIALLLMGLQSRGMLIALLTPPLLLLTFSGTVEKNLFEQLWNRTHAGKLIAYERTKYQTVYLESIDGQINVYGDGIFYYTLPDRYSARSIFHLVQSVRREEHKKILLLGTGPGSIPYNLQKTDIAEIHYFEIDPDLWRIVQPYQKSFYRRGEERAKMKVINQDLRHFLQEQPETYDIMICFPPEPENIMLNRFYTREFYALCREHIRPRGIIITSLHGFSNYLSRDLKRFMASIYKSFRSEFPHHLKTSGETMYLIGAVEPDVLPESVEQLIDTYRTKYSTLPGAALEGEITENFSPDELKMLFEKTQLEYFDRAVIPLIPGTEENLDLKPRGYWNQILLSAFQEQSTLYTLLREFTFFPGLSLIITLLILVIIQRRHGIRQLSNGIIIYFIGFISISTMILMIILYQNFTGIVYYRISLINALFMLGLTGGSFAFNRIRRKSLPLLFLMLAISLAAIYLYTQMRNEAIFWILIFSFSFFCGSVFPTLFTGMGEGDFHINASVLDSMDHFGSIIGSLLSVLFLLPLTGILGTLFTNMTIALITAVALLLARKHR